MLKRLYDWTLALAARETAEAWLAVIAFVESSVFLIPADVLFLPVGGKTTLGPAEAGLVINQLNPNLVFPMHYLTPGLEDFGLCDSPLEAFLSRMTRVEDQASMAYEVDLARLPMQTKIVLLKYE